MVKLNSVATLTTVDGIGVITIDSPPVNALSVEVRRGLVAGMQQANADPNLQAIVMICAGRTFFAGFDINEFNTGLKEPGLNELFASIENASKPVIAALHGTALGGGLELALACHYRIAVPKAKVGLPEVALGLLPGAGGTQRLPRIVGVEAALDMIVFGQPIDGRKALDLGLIDAMAGDEASLQADAVAFAKRLLAEKRPLKRVRDSDEKLESAKQNPGLFDAYRKKHARALRGFAAPENIIKAIEAATTLPFEDGRRREGELIQELMAGSQSGALRHLFFAERAAAKVPGLAPNTPTLPVQRVGVIGAGTMGGGIAMNFLNIGLPVTLVEQSQEALDRGVATIRRNYDATVKKGRLSAEALEQRMALLNPTLDFDALSAVDLVIEAVFERLDLKKQVFEKLDRVAAPHAILASNTSFLDLDAIATATRRPESVIGMHFFSPANVMRLLEVVRGAKTSDTLIATAMQLGRKIGKIAVLSRVCDGFIANRAMAVRSAQANQLILEGPLPWDIDRVMTEFGFAMGPFAMTDLVGLDVIGWDPKTSSSSSVIEVLCELGRWGQKKGGGYYDYDAQRVAAPSAVAEKVIRDFAARQSQLSRSFSDAEILERLLFPVVNECAKILQEGIAVRASDIDMALTTGYGWPTFTGGPTFWADTVGLDKIVASLDALADRQGEAFRPAELLRRTATSGAKLSAL